MMGEYFLYRQNQLSRCHSLKFSNYLHCHIPEDNLRYSVLPICRQKHRAGFQFLTIRKTARQGAKPFSVSDMTVYLLSGLIG